METSDEQILTRRAAESARRLLDESERDRADLAVDPKWTEGEQLAAAAIAAAWHVLAELELPYGGGCNE
jgi:hypothetical protein